jgi:hypothetical protein
MKLTLVRFAYLPDCTLGWMIAEPYRFATIERPWLPNPNGPGGTLKKSCVPEGTYVVRPHDGTDFQGVYALTNETLGVFYQTTPPECGPPNARLWGRTAILIHAGNFVRDVIGCIALGSRHVRPNGERAVVESGVALGRLRTLLGRAERHELGIMPTFGITSSKS